MFIPADGPSISQHKPLNAWTSFAPDLTQALENQGFARDDISVKTSGDLDAQSRAIQDYVVNILSANSAAASPAPSSSQSGSGDTASASADASSPQHTQNDVTMIVAPVAQAAQTSDQYGDYASRPIMPDQEDASSSTGEDEQTIRPAVNRLAAALQLAREAGVHIVVVSNAIPGFNPDVFVQMSTAEQIGAIQAQLLASKLQLDKISSDNPKSIEIMLPVTGSRHSGDDDDGNAATAADSAFAKAAFKGIWQVLQPYVVSGKVISPSGSFNAATTQDDWESSSFEADKPQQVQDELNARLAMTSGNEKHTRIDGVIALNDFVASGVITQLDKLGYTGSAADINPAITISGIVNNMTGRKDLVRQAVPDPAKQASPQNGEGAQGLEKVNSRWPIVTGYGAYRDTIAQIVNGKLWMTSLENRQLLVADIAQTCGRLNRGLTPGTLPFVKTRSLGGIRMPIIHEQLLAVSASNLKKTLIDPGYISLADAGL